MEQDIRKILNITVESPYWEDALAEAREMVQGFFEKARNTKNL